MSDIVERLRDDQPGERQSVREARMDLGCLLMEAADEIEKLRAALQTARRDGREEAARRVEIKWLMFREKDNGASDWIFRAHDDIPTGDDFVAAIRALGEKE